MRRFFTDKISKPEMLLGGAEHKHLAGVLRARVGEDVIVCTGDGIDYVYKIKSIDKRAAVLSYESESRNDTETDTHLTVFFAMLKGDKSELVVTKLTELGVKHIVPFVSEFTVKTGEKIDRMKRAALEACKQCGRAVIPDISDVISFKDVLSRVHDYDKVVFAYEGAYADGKRLRDVLDGKEKRVALIVGAEGGFSGNEVSALVGEDIPAVTLGKRIMRAETASIAAAAVILYICGEWE